VAGVQTCALPIFGPQRLHEVLLQDVGGCTSRYRIADHGRAHGMNGGAPGVPDRGAHPPGCACAATTHRASPHATGTKVAARAMRDLAYHPPVHAPSPATRLGVAFFALYTFVGLITPFWPLYLAYRGMNPQQVGVLMALTPWARFASNLGVGQLAQSLGQPRQLLLRLSIALVVAHALFPVMAGFAALLVLSLVVGVLSAPLSPPLHSPALAASLRGEANSGHGRGWRSI